MLKFRCNLAERSIFMKKIAFSKVAIAAGLAAILILGITTAAAPSANKERI